MSTFIFRLSELRIVTGDESFDVTFLRELPGRNIEMEVLFSLSLSLSFSDLYLVIVAADMYDI